MEQRTKATRSDREERREQLHELRPKTVKAIRRTRKRMAWGDLEEHRERSPKKHLTKYGHVSNTDSSVDMSNATVT